jgi:hypothetical protein
MLVRCRPVAAGARCRLPAAWKKRRARRPERPEMFVSQDLHVSSIFQHSDSRSLVEVDWWRRCGVLYVLRTRVATRCHGAGVLCAYADTPCASCHPCQSRPSVSDYLAVGVVCSVRSRGYRTTDIIPSATQSRKAKG